MEYNVLVSIDDKMQLYSLIDYLMSKLDDFIVYGKLVEKECFALITLMNETTLTRVTIVFDSYEIVQDFESTLSTYITFFRNGNVAVKLTLNM